MQVQVGGYDAEVSGANSGVVKRRLKQGSDTFTGSFKLQNDGGGIGDRVSTKKDSQELRNTLKSLYLDPIQEAGSLFLNFAHQLSLPFQRENSA